MGHFDSDRSSIGAMGGAEAGLANGIHRIHIDPVPGGVEMTQAARRSVGVHHKLDDHFVNVKGAFGRWREAERRTAERRRRDFGRKGEHRLVQLAGRLGRPQARRAERQKCFADPIALHCGKV